MGRPIINLEGQTFGRLTVRKDVGRSKRQDALWRCRCVCGNEVTVCTSKLRGGRTQSCGCLRNDMTAELGKMYGGAFVDSARKAVLTHGHCAQYATSPTYRSWRNMISRCTFPSHSSFPCYGGSGVMVAPEWITFEGFIGSMGERPEGTTLGRILDMGNYEPGNAFWQTDAEQKLAARNKRALLKWQAVRSA